MQYDQDYRENTAPSHSVKKTIHNHKSNRNKDNTLYVLFIFVMRKKKKKSKYVPGIDPRENKNLNENNFSIK